MTSDPELERRMSRLENETVAIYELIDDFRGETRTLFDRIDTRLDGIDTRLDRTETRFDRTETRFDRIDTTLGEVLQRLPEPT